MANMGSNSIHALESSEGILTFEKEIHQHVHSHFKKLFGSVNPNRIQIEEGQWNLIVDLTSLDENFTKDE